MNLIKYTSDVGAAPGMIKTNAADAAIHLQARYRALSAIATKAAAIARQTKRPVPKSFLEAYSRAYRDYLRFGNELFAILAKKGVHVEQIVYQGGKPVPSSTNPLGVRTVKIDAPLHPPVLYGMDDRGDLRASRVAGDEVGVVPIVIGLYVVGGIVFTAIAGYVSVKVLREIRIIMRGPDYEPDKQAEASLKLFKGYKEGGVEANKAAELTTKGTAAPPGSAAGHPPSAGIGIGAILIGVAVLGGGAYMLSKKAA